MSSPKVSVIIPCYNYGSYLKECLHGALAADINTETHETIVVDDGSTDDTADVVAGFGPRVRYLHQPNAGLSAARNTGMAAASGEYLLFLDADDMLASNTIRSQASVLDAHPETDIVVCQVREALSMAPGAPLAPVGFWLLFRDNLPLHFCHLNIAPPHAFMIRRDRALANGTFDTNLRACEDYDFWFRCAARGMTFRTNTATHVIYRKHARSMSARKDNQLLHDAIMHSRTARALAEQEAAIEGPAHTKWMAHASGCLVTAFRMFGIQARNMDTLFELCLRSVIRAAKNWDKRDAPSVITQYYANKLMLHLRLFAQLRNPTLVQVEAIMAKLHPDLQGSLGSATRREAELIPVVHHPQSYAKQDDPGTTRGGKRILLCSDFFWPSTGGCELFLEDLGSRLVELGHEVHVVTRGLPERNVFHKNGIHIIQFQCSGRFRDASLGEQYNAYAHFLNNSSYDSIFIIGQPDSWQHAPLLSAARPPDVHLIPIINQELTDDWKRLGQEHLVAAVLRKARSCLSLTESGLDARFVRAAGVTPLFVPHALTPHPPRPGFRARHDLADDTPLLVHVGNFWPVKNQLALVQTFKNTPGAWTLALIGARLPWPGESAYHDAIAAEAATDPRIRLLGPLPPEEADAAIAEADILLLSSKAECRPLVILQAMHHGTPWIATPECNSVHDDAGGVVCPLEHFPRIAQTLIEAPQLRIALGTLGREHWRQCFSWEAVLPLFTDLIETGCTKRHITLPLGIRTAQRRLAEKIVHNVTGKSENAT